jgi:hypothetical protein
MQSIQLRMGLAFCAVLAMMAVVAPAASAVVDFPHEESASKWAGVEVYDLNYNPGASQPCDGTAPGGAECAFEAADEQPKEIMYGLTINCGTSTIKGNMTVTGVVSVSQVSGCLGSSSAGTGRICQHKPTREYWVRYTSSSGGAVMFGHFDVDPSGYSSTPPTDFLRDLVFGTPTDDVYTKINGAGTAAEYQQAEYPELWPNSTMWTGAGSGANATCAWPGLSA